MIVVTFFFIAFIVQKGNAQEQYDARLEDYFHKRQFVSYFKRIDTLGNIASKQGDLAALKLLYSYLKRDFTALSKLERLFLRTSATYLANHISKQTSERELPLELYLISHNNVSNKITLDSLSWFIENKICIIYIEEGNYEKAGYYGALVQRSLRHYKQFEYLSRYYTNMGRSLASQLRLEEAQQLFLHGYRLADSIAYYNGIFANAINLAELYNTYPEMGDPDEFLQQAEAVLPLFSQDQDYKRRLGSFLVESARDTIQNGFYNAGFVLFRQGIDLLDDYYSDDQRRQMAKQFSLLGNAYLLVDSIDQALHTFQQGLRYLIPESLMSGLPEAREIYAENSFLNLLDLWQSLCEKNYAATKDVQYLHSALSGNKLALFCNDLIREQLFASGSKLLSVRDNKELIHRGISYLERLQQVDSSTDYMSEVRAYFSRSKSLLYSESRKRNQIAALMDEADRIRWKVLLDTIQGLRDQKYEAGADFISINGAILRCEEKIEELFSLYKDHVREISRPTDYIEYLVTDNKVYAMAELGSTKIFRSVGDKEVLNNLLARLNHFIALKGYSMDKRILTDLYLFLVEPVDSVLPQRLVIIPDEEIGYIPFEILQDPHGEYLIRSTSISYQVEYENEVIELSEDEKQWDILCLAPEYPEKPGEINVDRGSFFHLPYAEAEIDTITSLFEERAFKARNSDKEEWMSKLLLTKIFHYAGHAVVDGDIAYLALSSADDLRQNLTTEDIQLLHLPLELVVLSACETGLGKLQLGEGIESLGRSFMEAGARSTLISLWNVNDKSTAMIMADFYNYLKEGRTKDESIRMAKLNYLDTISPKLRHPYYWGAFIPAGNMDSI